VLVAGQVRRSMRKVPARARRAAGRAAAHDLLPYVGRVSAIDQQGNRTHRSLKAALQRCGQAVTPALVPEAAGEARAARGACLFQGVLISAGG
jgi:hypothetical protein